MTQVNATTGQRVTETINTESGMETTRKVIQNLDSISIAMQGDGSVPIDANAPVLPRGFVQAKAETSPPATATDEEIQKMLQQLAQNSANFQKILASSPAITHQQVLNYILNYATQRGGAHNQILFNEALAHYIRDQQNTGVIKSNDAANILNNLRIALYSESDPEISLLINALKTDYMAQGKSETEALALAQQQALGDIDDFLNENEVHTPLLGANPLLKQAIINAIAKQFNLDPDTAKAYAEGMTNILTAFPGVSQWFQNLAAVSPENGVEGAASTTPAANITTAASTMLDQTDALVQGVYKIVNSLPLSENEKVSMLNYIRTIGELIAEMRQMLNLMQVSDAQNQAKATAAEKDLIKARLQVTLDKLEKSREQAEKQAKINKIMSIVMPIVSALVMIGGILMTPFSGGLSLALTIGICVALFATFTALQATGTMQKIFDKINTAIDEMVEKIGGSNTPSWAKKLTKALIYVAVIAVLIAIMVASRGSAGSLVANMVCMTLASSILSSSGIVAESVKTVIKAVDPKATEETIAIWTAVISVLLMIVLAIISFKCMSAPKTGDATNMLAEFTSRARDVGTALEAGANVAGAATSIYKGIVEVELSKMVEKQALLEEQILMINEIIKMLQKLINGLITDAEGMQQQSAGLTELFNSVLSGQRDVISQLTRHAA